MTMKPLSNLEKMKELDERKPLTKESFMLGYQFRHKSSGAFVYRYIPYHDMVSNRLITNEFPSSEYPADYNNEAFKITHYAFGLTQEQQIFFNDCTLYEG